MDITRDIGLRSRVRRRRIAAAFRRLGAVGRVTGLQPPVEWAETHIDLSRDNTAAATGLIQLRRRAPYLVRPVSYAMRRGRRKLTVQAVEQTGKSTVWKLVLMWVMQFRPCAAGLIYQNKPVGQTIIRDSLVPLLRGIPDFDRAIRHHGWSLERLQLDPGLVYLMTGDGEIISYPLGLIIGDEINKWRRERASRRQKRRRRWESDTDYQVSKIADMDKRGRTYEDFLRVLVCSPEGPSGPITTEYLHSSMGRYHCRCRGCGELVFDTTRPEEYFRYDTTADGDVAAESIRLVCPECRHEHVEDRETGGLTDKQWITIHGDYIDEHPERLATHEGDCWGALASQFPGVGWAFICDAIEQAKRENDRETQAFFWNSVKGLAFAPEVVSGNKLSAIRKHHRWPDDTGLPPAVIDDIEAVYLAVDTQDVGYWWTVMGVDVKNNWYTLGYGYAYEDADVERAWNGRYHDLRPMAAIIDEGGHRKDEVTALREKLGAGVYLYKGESRVQKGIFRKSDDPEQPYLILANAREYQANLLYMMYSLRRDPRDREVILRDRNYWWVACEMRRDFLRQLAAVQPPPNNPDAEYRDWTHGDRQHDLFDTHKMCLVLHDFAKKYFGAEFWRRGRAKFCAPRREVVLRRRPGAQPKGRLY